MVKKNNEISIDDLFNQTRRKTVTIPSNNEDNDS